MASLPFARHTKKRAEETTTGGSYEVAQFFSNDPRPGDPSGDDAQEAVTVEQVPPVPLQNHREPGWYPDPTDPAIMRYWDGFHMTGQAVRVDPAEAQAAQAPPADGVDESPISAIARTTDRVASSRSQFVPLLGPMDADEPVSPPPHPPAQVAPLQVAPVQVESPPTDSSTGAVGSLDLDLDPDLEPDSVPAEQPVGSGQMWTTVPTAGDTDPAAEDRDGADDDAFVGDVDSADSADIERGDMDTGTRSEMDTATTSDIDTATEDMESGPVDPDATPQGAPFGHDERAASFPAASGNGSRGDNGRGADGGNPSTPVPGHARQDAITPEAPVETDNWAEQTDRAVARARAAGTPEAWKEAAQFAIVVTEMAQTMQTTAEATQVAARAAQVAKEATGAATVAAHAAAEASRAVQQTAMAADQATEAADQAAEAARAAEQAADEAKRTAEQKAEATPRFAEAARVAAQAAADAENKARGLEEIVANARTANSPAAWSEALELATAAMHRSPVSAA